jgi:hypothetical protein
MRTGTALALALTLIAGAGLAEAPATSIRPLPRPAAQATPMPPAPEAGAAAAEPAAATPTVAPRPRPTAQAEPEPSLAGGVAAAPKPTVTPRPRPESLPTAPEVEMVVQSGASPFPNGVLRPRPRPADLIQAAANTAPLAPAKKPKASAKGAVCGDPALKGQALEPITSRVNGCGVAEPVQVTSVSGVVLNPPAILDCSAALALRRWVDEGLQPAFRPTEVVELRVFGSYMCRSRNNVRGAKISEHGRGRAVDIGAFVLSSGKTITVASNYNAQVRKAYKAACGIFGTTLGPGSDGYHEDHLHFDIASYRSGTYCR